MCCSFVKWQKFALFDTFFNVRRIHYFSFIVIFPIPIVQQLCFCSCFVILSKITIIWFEACTCRVLHSHLRLHFVVLGYAGQQNFTNNDLYIIRPSIKLCIERYASHRILVSCTARFCTRFRFQNVALLKGNTAYRCKTLSLHSYGIFPPKLCCGHYFEVYMWMSTCFAHRAQQQKNVTQSKKNIFVIKILWVSFTAASFLSISFVLTFNSFTRLHIWIIVHSHCAKTQRYFAILQKIVQK